MADAAFTDDERARLDAWYEAERPGDPWAWLGMSKNEYEAKRATDLARMHAWLNKPIIAAWIARRKAQYQAEQLRWADDGGAIAPDDHEFANCYISTSPPINWQTMRRLALP